MVDKLVKDGMVAVLYSPGYGAGWYTWAGEKGEEMLFDPVLAQAILNGKSKSEIEELAESRYPDEYCGGAEDLQVAWLPEGTLFHIDEYDGSESVRLADHQQWIKA